MCAEGQEPETLLNSRFRFGVRDARWLIYPLVEADEQIELIVVVRQCVTTQSQYGVANLAFKMALDRLECHANFCHVIHDDVGIDKFFVEGSVLHLRAHSCLCFPQKFSKFHSQIISSFLRAVVRPISWLSKGSRLISYRALMTPGVTLPCIRRGKFSPISSIAMSRRENLRWY